MKVASRSKRSAWAKTALLPATLPVWLPLLLLFPVVVIVVTWGVIRWHVWRPVESAWARCAKVWLRDDRACVTWTDLGFSPGLMLALAKAHRRRRAFFLERLRNPEPVLAAYACLCLAHAGGLRPEEVPDEVRRRPEVIEVPYGDTREGRPLGGFVAGFASGEGA